MNSEKPISSPSSGAALTSDSGVGRGEGRFLARTAIRAEGVLRDLQAEGSRTVRRRPTSWLPRSVAPLASARVARVRSRATQQSILVEAAFRDVIARERKRAERFDDHSVLIVIDTRIAGQNLPDGGPRRTARWWEQTVRATRGAAGDTAVLGWLDTHVTLGVVVPLAPGTDVQSRVERALGKSIDHDTRRRLVVRLQQLSSGPAPAAQWVEELGQPQPGHRPAYLYVKRALDVVTSALLLTLMWPLLLVLAALVRLTSPGPALFRQQRVGYNGRPFTMWKFRTMRVDADPTVHHEFVKAFIRPDKARLPASQEGLFKLVDDSRVTALGRILRESSLDELPQLWNVLRGEMSLVGPRPPLPTEVEEYAPWHIRRVLEATPGMTGLWQVRGRSRTTFAEMVRLDLRYVRTRSFRTDLRILLATPRAVLSGEGAR